MLVAPRPLPLRIASAVMGVLFAFAALVQLNDPDPIRWVLVYGAAAALSMAAAVRRLPPLLPGVLAVAALCWAVTLGTAISSGNTDLREMLRSYEMMSPAMEEGREALGLGLVAGWMTALAGHELWRRRREPRGETLAEL